MPSDAKRDKERTTMISQDDMWRDIINNELHVFEDVEDTLTTTPPSEMSSTKPEPKKGQHFFVQKILTEVYIYTDVDAQKFGEMSFQDVVILGDMPAEKMLRLFKKKRKQQEDPG